MCHNIPVVVGLPGVGVEVHRVSPGPVVEGDGGARLYLHPGKQALTRSRDSENQCHLSLRPDSGTLLLYLELAT